MVDFDLTCWYLNLRRVAELIGSQELIDDPALAGIDDLRDINSRRVLQLALFKDKLVSWLQANEVKTLGEIIVRRAPKDGDLFTHYGDFYCRGLPGYRSHPGRSAERPLIYAKFHDYGRQQRLVRVPYDPGHLTSNSSYHELSGHKRLFVAGLVSGSSSGGVETRPYAIASLVAAARSRRFWWGTHREVFVGQIGSFAKVEEFAEERMQTSDLEVLRRLPERRIKEIFATIIGEPMIPRDWGGETSDLYTTMVRLNGKRVSAAFAFKGPARFGPLKLSRLGKNGDQIDRLFSEPADLLVLQHCHLIEKSVRSVMRAYAERISAPRLFCLIDGFDTLRILKAYAPESLGGSMAK